jgi:cytochrome oxidase assembly protein ShyY1
MDDRRARRRRNWIVLGLVAISVPVLAYLGLMLAIGLGMQSGY